MPSQDARQKQPNHALADRSWKDADLNKSIPLSNWQGIFYFPARMYEFKEA